MPAPTVIPTTMARPSPVRNLRSSRFAGSGSSPRARMLRGSICGYRTHTIGHVPSHHWCAEDTGRSVADTERGPQVALLQRLTCFLCFGVDLALLAAIEARRQWRVAPGERLAHTLRAW